MGIIADRNKRGGQASPNIMGGYGTPDYYRFYKKNGGALDKSAFSRILRASNAALVEEMLESAEQYSLPYGLGQIVFRKRKNKAFMTDKGLKSNSPVNWKETMELWEKDSHAHRNKIRVKYSNMHTGRYSFKIRCFGRKFKNKEYFMMTFKRSLKRAFADRINTYNKPKIDAYINKNI